MSSIQHVFITGCKGIPAQYGGFETFVEKLTEHRIDQRIQYHVACLSNKTDQFEHNDAHCFDIRVPNIGSAKAIYYDIAALRYCYNYIRANKISHPIVYILACRIGPYAGLFKRLIHRAGGVLYINPDGHEWKRGKWSWPVQKYWMVSEKLMVKHSDLIICDSMNIKKYIHATYPRYRPNTTFIPYGAETKRSTLSDCSPAVSKWFGEKQVQPKEYYLVVGRFVPENNYFAIISEFIRSATDKALVLITGVSNTTFYEKLRMVTNFDQDERIKFVGTVYDQELLQYIRENAYAYLHGHEVGGTNPSLLEALANTELNLLLDVGFNREVAEDGALYWTKEGHSLSELITAADGLSEDEITLLGKRARKRIEDIYNWPYVTEQYEAVFGTNLLTAAPKQGVEMYGGF